MEGAITKIRVNVLEEEITMTLIGIKVNDEEFDGGREEN